MLIKMLGLLLLSHFWKDLFVLPLVGFVGFFFTSGV